MKIHQSSLLLLLAGHSPVAAAVASSPDRLSDDRLLSPEQLAAREALLSGGSVLPRRDVEIVLSHYAEDASWASEYAPFVTLYSHGDPADARLPDSATKVALKENVGKESHVYLTHIVRNYDNLAEWTVFSQSGYPSAGYVDAGGDGGGGHSGGHLVRGSVFEDYVLAYASGMESYFVASSAVESTTLDHNIRDDFASPKGDADQAERDAWGLRERCPPADSPLWMREWIVVSASPDFAPLVAQEEQCGDSCPTMKEFAESLNIPGDFEDGRPVMFGQGARFAVSREVLLRHPKSYYEAILEEVSHHPDPWQGYYIEYLWYQIVAADPLPTEVAGQANNRMCPEVPSWDLPSHHQSTLRIIRGAAVERNLGTYHHRPQWDTTYHHRPHGSIYHRPGHGTCAHELPHPCHNPCFPYTSVHGLYYYEFCAGTGGLEDDSKFVQCDAHGGCFVQDCPPGTYWDQGLLTCNHRNQGGGWWGW